MWGIESEQLQVDISNALSNALVNSYAGLNVMILLFELHRCGKSHEELREKISFNPCGQINSKEFDETKLLRIIRDSYFPKVKTFVQIVGKFLSGADLSHADLTETDLNGADLSFADLSHADFSEADLSGANLSGADLSYVGLLGTKLNDANLSGADLNRAELDGAHLFRADLSDADLSGAYLYGTFLINIKWNNNTKWSNAVELHMAIRVPEELQQNPEFAAAVAQSRAASQKQQ